MDSLLVFLDLICVCFVESRCWRGSIARFLILVFLLLRLTLRLCTCSISLMINIKRSSSQAVQLRRHQRRPSMRQDANARSRLKSTGNDIRFFVLFLFCFSFCFFVIFFNIFLFIFLVSPYRAMVLPAANHLGKIIIELK